MGLNSHHGGYFGMGYPWGAIPPFLTQPEYHGRLFRCVVRCWESQVHGVGYGGVPD